MTNTSNYNILNNLTKYVKQELENENIPTDAKFAVVATVNVDGAKILAAVNIIKTEKTDLKVAAVWEHDWDGDNTVGAKLIFVGK